MEPEHPGEFPGPPPHPTLDPPPDPVLGPGPVLLLVEAGETRPIGPATVDSDADGVADTALVAGSGSDVMALATDLDGDALVDVLTTVHADGTASTTFPTHGWSDGAGWSDGDAPPAPSVDPETGRWIRSV